MPVPEKSSTNRHLRQPSRPVASLNSNEKSASTALTNVPAVASKTRVARSGLPQPRSRPTSIIFSTAQAKSISTLRTSEEPSSDLEQAKRPASSDASAPTTSRLASSAKSHSRQISYVQSKSASKPAFATFQQHYTPKKQASQPKPSDGHDQIAPQATARSTSAVSHLQDELLQLQLVYEPCHQNLRLYKQKALSSLKARHDKFHAEQLAVVELENQQRTQIQRSDLREWLSQDDGYSEQEKITILSKSLRELQDLSSHVGGVDELIEQFNRWYERVILILDERSNSERANASRLEFIEPLGLGWTDGVVLAQRKLQHCMRCLGDLATPRPGTTTAFVLGKHQQLAKMLYDELCSSTTIEKLVLENEKEWIDETLARVLETKVPSPAGLVAEREGVWIDS